MYEGKYRSARENLRQAILLTTSSDRLLANARNHLYLAILEEELGALGEAVPELDRARQALAAVHDAPVWLGARIATAYARAGRVGLADEMLAELKTRTDASSPDDASELSRAEGEAALARGQFESGLELLQQAYLAANWPLTVASLARGYDRAGDRSHANEYREKLVAMRGGALGWEPQQDWIAAHVELAGFYRSRGETALARRTLDSIATFRANADADAPITREIKQMQADLR
jgi:tetratricopeptide (TPR) repeat protein